MFLGTYEIDEYVAITATTHRFSSGAAYAPTVITYSIYEEGNTTGIDENVDMVPASPFDSVVGFYYSRRQLTAAAGFEYNKTYVVLVKATVDSISAIESHTFQIRHIQTGDAYTILTSAISEMSQGDPPDSPTITEVLNYLYRDFRNKKETTNSTCKIYDTAGSSVLVKETHSDDTVTFTKGKYETGA